MLLNCYKRLKKQPRVGQGICPEVCYYGQVSTVTIKNSEALRNRLNRKIGPLSGLITALADASLPTLEVSRRYKKEEAKKKELEAHLCRQKKVATDFKVDLEEIRHLMR